LATDSLLSVIEVCRDKCVQTNFTALNQNLNMGNAYSLVKQYLSCHKAAVSAWKLGGTNNYTQKLFNVDRAYFGPLFAHEVLFIDNVKGNLPQLSLLKGEAEVALRLSSFGADSLNSESQDANVIFDAWSAAIEFPYSVFSDLPGAGVEALIIDRCAAGALVLGPIQKGLPSKEFTIAIDVKGKERSAGSQDDMLLHPTDAALEFRHLAFENGFDLRAGQWVSTGGLTSCLRLTKDDIITLEYDDRIVFTLDNR